MDAGFRLRDAAQMVAVLRQLIFDHEGGMLHEVYALRKVSPHESVDRETLNRIVEARLLLWPIGLLAFCATKCFSISADLRCARLLARASADVFTWNVKSSAFL